MRNECRIFFYIFLMQIIFCNSPVWAQIPHIKLSGRVTDASTGAPLYFVNVFLSNTMKGAATDEEGRFSIVNVPLGTYELIASMIGYEIEVIKIKLTESREYVFQIKLNPKAIEAPLLEVTGRYPKKWKKQLKEFITLILGETENAKHCKILNPEFLSFEEDKKEDTFIATTEGPLKIENRALGYQLTLHLKELRFEEKSIISTKGYVLFQPLAPVNEKEQKYWDVNRKETYEGSLRHFFISLLSNRLREEGFRIFGSTHRSLRSPFIDEIPDINDLISPGIRLFEKKLLFKDYLGVSYRVYDKGGWIDRERSKLSHLRITNGVPIIINSSGLVYNSKYLTQYGSWSIQRLADELPWDYMPDENLK